MMFLTLISSSIIQEEWSKKGLNDMTIKCIKFQDSRHGKIYIQILESGWKHIDKYSWRAEAEQTMSVEWD